MKTRAKDSYLSCSSCSFRMRGRQLVYIGKVDRSILCSNCVLGTIDSKDYNMYFKKAKAGSLIQHIQEKQAQRVEEDLFLSVFVDAFSVAARKREEEKALKEVDTALRELVKAPECVAWFADLRKSIFS